MTISQASFLAAALLLAPISRAGDVGSMTVAPLAARSGPPGATLFTRLPPEATGVVAENAYADPKMWGERFQEFSLGSLGTGVAIGDYDNDGLPDLFVVSKTGRSRLFRNLGHWHFQDVTESAWLVATDGPWARGLAWVKNQVGSGADDAGEDAEHWRQGVAWADVDNDGWLDLYVCRLGAPNLLYINQHDGTFREEAAARGLAVVDACGVAAFCDYDRDGWLDVYIQTNLLDATAHPRGQPDHLFHNNGDGTFTDVTARAGIRGETLGHSATWWDYDEDGWPDLYVANDFAAPDSLYRNNRDGTFTDTLASVVPHTSFSSMGADLGDVNNDGRIDLFVAEMAATSHEKDQRGMASSRSLNQAKDPREDAPPQFLRNVLYLNTGTGRMLEAAYLAGLPATDWTWSPRFEDLDNDGRLDLHVTNGTVREFHNVELFGRIMSTESPAERMRLMRASPVLAEANLAYRNLGDLRFEAVGAAWGLDQRGVSFGSAFADFDGDGDLDLVYANYQASPTLLRNDCPSGHRLVVALRGTRSNRFGVGATVRIETAAGPQVRTLVLARGYLSTSEPILHFGLGNDTVIQRLTVAWPSGQSQTFTDLHVDQKLTITEPPPESGPVGAALRRDDSSELRHKAAPTANPSPQFAEISRSAGLQMTVRQPWAGEGSPQPLLPFRQNHRGPALAVGDLDGDGTDDLVLGGTAEDSTRIALANGPAGAFTTLDGAAFVTTSSLEDGPILIFDADGDGTNDLLLTKFGASLPATSSDYQPRLFLNQGHASFRPAPADALPSLPISVGAVAAVDFDRDGRLDLFIGGRLLPGKYPLPARSALLANRGGRFADVTDTLAPALREIGLVTAALWTDADGDGWPDLLVALEWGGAHYFHNNAGHGFTDWSERAGFAAAGTGWWTSLAAADFNGDSRPDYVCGNVGLNTPYQATSEFPSLLFYGNFEPGASPQLVEACYENARLYPRLTRNELGAGIPSVLKRFPGNNAYARATLPEIVGSDRLAAAQRFAATELRSGVFLSQPDNTWRFEPLPRIAQIAPFQGIAAGDFDGDGRTDLYAVQNSYAPVRTVGRFDGGLSQLFRGDGHGHFTPVAPADSGLVVPGDAKALVVLDLDDDGWPDFCITRNHDTTLAYRNHGVAGHRSLRVVLHGPAGNPTAIGARVNAELADGSTQTVEVHAGSGYYSQSAAACFFGCLDSNPLRRIHVRWPSGRTTASAVPVEAKTLSLSAPAP